MRISFRSSDTPFQYRKISLSSILVLLFAIYSNVGISQIVQAFDVNMGNSHEVNASVFNEELYFIHDDNGTGDELYKIDDSGSLVLISDIQPGLPSSFAKDFCEFDNKLYFRAYTDDEGYALWRYDGTNPPYRIGNDNLNPGSLVRFEDMLYFSGFNEQISATNHLGFFTQSQFFGAPPVGDINNIDELFVFGSKLLFIGETEDTGSELYQYESFELSLVADINPGQGNGANIKPLGIFNDAVYFKASNGTDGDELWKYDGINPPSMVADINPNGSSSPDNMTIMNGEMYFTAFINSKWDILRYDGINPPISYSEHFPAAEVYDPQDLSFYNNKIYFSASNEEYGRELFSLDGESPIQLVQDLHLGNAPSNPTDFIVFEDKLHFLATSSSHRAWFYVGQCTHTTSIDQITSCGSFTWIDGNTYTDENNTAEHISISEEGCSHTTTLDLIIENIEAEIIEENGVYTATEPGLEYQWLNCGKNMTPIIGETSQTFTPNSEGSYAVIVSSENCIEYSECTDRVVTGIAEDEVFEAVSLFPNPTTGTIHITLGSLRNVDVKIMDITGKEIKILNSGFDSQVDININGSKGIYFIELTHSNNTHYLKVIKQ